MAAVNDDDGNCKAACLPHKHVKFVGRISLCNEVVSHVNSGCRLIVLSAPPGYGKSEAIITIGHKLETEEGFYILYFSLKEVTTLYDATVLILETLREPVNKPVLQLQSFLKSLPKKTVLILDNTENVQEKDNEEFLKFLKEIGRLGKKLCTLVTTTKALDHEKRFPFDVKLIPLEPLSVDECLLLFNKYVPDMAIPKIQAKQLCKACMQIPIFLEIAASQVKEGSNILLLIRDLEANPQLLLQEDDDYFKHMKVFFSNLPESLKVVLAHLAVFPTPFTFDEARLLFRDDQEKMKADFNIHIEMHKLMNNALLKYDEEKKTYQLHNVVQSVCKSEVDKVVFESYNMAVPKFIEFYLEYLRGINIKFISHEGKTALDDYLLSKRKILHALSLSIEYDYKRAIDVSTEVVNLLAKCLNIKEFEKIYQGLANKARAEQDDKPYSDCLTSIGFKLLYYHGKENPKDAFDVLFEAENLQRSSQLPETEERAHCISKLGLCYARQGKIERGVRMIVHGIVIRKTLHARLGSVTSEMLICGGYCDLAMALSTANKVKAAVKIWETICLEGYRRILNCHPFTASLLQYIGDAYHQLHNYQQAKKYKREALQMRRHLLTTYHQDTARSLSSLAQTLEKLDRQEEAVEMLQETHRIQSKVWASPEDIKATKGEIQRMKAFAMTGTEM